MTFCPSCPRSRIYCMSRDKLVSCVFVAWSSSENRLHATHGHVSLFALKCWVAWVVMLPADRTPAGRRTTSASVDGRDLKRWPAAPHLPSAHVAARPSFNRGRRPKRGWRKRHIHLMHFRDKSLRNQIPSPFSGKGYPPLH